MNITPAVKCALEVLNQWQLSPKQRMNLLSYKTMGELLNIETSAKIGALSEDQESRVGLILNIHQALRTVFNNPTNVCGYMTFVNRNY